MGVSWCGPRGSSGTELGATFCFQAAEDRDLRFDLYETDVADQKRNHMIDLEGTLSGLCDYSSVYCSEADESTARSASYSGSRRCSNREENRGPGTRPQGSTAASGSAAGLRRGRSSRLRVERVGRDGVEGELPRTRRRRAELTDDEALVTEREAGHERAP